MMNRTMSLILKALVVTGVFGCDSATIYNGTRQPAAVVTPREQWSVKEANGVDSPELAFDGGNGAATTSTGYQGATLTIDLGKVCYFNEIIVDHGPNEMGFAGRVAVSTSVDGKTFHKRFDGPGTRGVSIFSLVAPALARYVRLQVVYSGNEAWTLGEIYLR